MINNSSDVYLYLNTNALRRIAQMMAVVLLTASATNASHVFTFSDLKRIEAPISATAMNRLAVVNDRIAHVFGDEGTFVSQADEHTGQLFTKPTAENGLKPLSLTLITENGTTQDLTLKPGSKTAETLIFKNGSGTNSTGSTPNYLGPAARSVDTVEGLNNRYANAEDDGQNSPSSQIINFLKQVTLGGAKSYEGEKPSRYSPAGYSLTYQGSYAAHQLIADCYTVSNTTATAMEIQEKTFYQQGDLALSFKNRLLKPQGSTVLYVVRMGA